MEAQGKQPVWRRAVVTKSTCQHLQNSCIIFQICIICSKPKWNMKHKIRSVILCTTYRSDVDPYTAALGFHAWCPVCGNDVYCWAYIVHTVIHPRRSKGLWPGSTQHRLSHKSHSDATSPELHLLESPHTGLAVWKYEGRKDRTIHEDTGGLVGLNWY